MPRAANTQRTQIPSVERKIYFYRMNPAPGDEITDELVDVSEILAQIEALPFEEINGRYLPIEDNAFLCSWIDSHSQNQRMKFGQIRRAALPLLENRGNLSDLNIPVNAGLLEASHVIFFENNIIGSEFNFHGPRLTRLASYIRETTNLYPYLTIEPLLRPDVEAELARVNEVKLLRLKIKPSFIDVVCQADRDLGAAFEAARSVAEQESIEISLRFSAQSTHSVLSKVQSIGRFLLGRPNIQTEAESFELRGRTRDNDKLHTVDLLKDQLIVTKRIIKHSARSRALSSEHAYEAIEEAYLLLRPQLVEASSLGE
jgi:hypothetical protein